MVVGTLLKLNIEAGNARNTGTTQASSSARILEQLKSVTQSSSASSAIHGINMILATWVYVPVGFPHAGTTTSNIAGSALQRTSLRL